jgi:hypothetical protein
VIFLLESHRAVDGVVELECNGHQAVLASGTSGEIIMCLLAANQDGTEGMPESIY